MILLPDSAVWLDASLGLSTEATRFVKERGEHEEIATTGVIFQEVIQGVRSKEAYEHMRDAMWRTLVLEPVHLITHEVAATLYRRARAMGLTIRSSNGCLIAALALEHGALVVHNDQDFLALAQVEPSLHIFPARAH
jgi:predicted nucleic acid-binding protein